MLRQICCCAACPLISRTERHLLVLISMSSDTAVLLCRQGNGSAELRDLGPGHIVLDPNIVPGPPGINSVHNTSAFLQYCLNHSEGLLKLCCVANSHLRGCRKQLTMPAGAGAAASSWCCRHCMP